MASTLELLDAIDAQVEEDICIVDAVNRTISVPESLRLLGVESDEKAEVRRFRCPKIVGNNIDLTALILFINFENAGGQKGAYRIKDVEEEGDGTNITFSWELERKVTAYQGTPKFSLCAQRVKSGDDGTLEQEWNTTFNEECEVLEGLEVQESIEEEESGALTQIWQKIDELELAIDEGGLGGGIKEETDPTVPSWAKNPTKPTYTASEVGADASGTAETKVTEHNVDDEAHNDIRLLVQGLTQKLNALADSDDDTLDQLSEIVAYIKNNKSLIDGITTSKVNVSDIINNLTTNVSNKPLSAAQGVVLKSLIDGIIIPENLPNPYKLKFSGAVTGEYDGSTEQTITIPQSGGSGTSDYSELQNKPKLNNVELVGNKTLSNIGAQPADCVVNVTVVGKGDGSYDVTGVDKEVAEITDAISEGRRTVAYVESLQKELPVGSYSSGEMVMFSLYQGLKHYVLIIANDENTFIVNDLVAGHDLGGVKATPLGRGDENYTVEAKIDSETSKLYVPTYPASENTGEWEEIADVTTEEDLVGVLITKDKNDNPFSLKKVMVTGVFLPISDATEGNGGDNVKIDFNASGPSGWSSKINFSRTPTKDETESSAMILAEVTGGMFAILNKMTSFNDTNVSRVLIFSSNYEVGVSIDKDGSINIPAVIDRVNIASYKTTIGAGSRIRVWGIRA